ncbi:MAG TPA: preprotein translocase subunit SecE, partial [Candidatus Saccharimonadales bacterium]|nr:preprotein translocase subunit SecE [Candidatus Saccharimonadales bacterium]
MAKGASKKTSGRKARIPRPKIPPVIGKVLYYPRLVLRFIFWPLRPFGRYFKGAWQELKEVTWPNRKMSIQLTLAVIVFTLLLSAVIAALDFGFEQLVK